MNANQTKYDDAWSKKRGYANKAEWAREHRKALKAEAHAALGNKCAHCGFSDPRALQIDHVNGGGRQDLGGRSRNNPTYYKQVIESAKRREKKYQLLCANCNWIKRHTHNEHN